MSKKKKSDESSGENPGHAVLTLTIAVPVEGDGEVDFGPLVAGIEAVIAEQFPDAVIEEQPAGEGDLMAAVIDPPAGHHVRPLLLTDEQWAAVDRQAKRGKISGSDWLRRFLAPYLRRG